MGRIGRPQKPYQSKEGPIAGLARDTDGRWRILKTRERFREPDERLAILRFRQWQERNAAPEPVTIPPADDGWMTREQAALLPSMTEEQKKRVALGHVMRKGALVYGVGREVDRLVRGTDVEDKALWAYLREQLIERPEWVAEKVGIPELAGLKRFDLPKPPLPIERVIKAYLERSDATPKSKQEALKPFERLVAFTGVKTLDGLTDEKLSAFRRHVVEDPALKSSQTVAAYFTRIRNVIRLAGRGDLDGDVVAKALERCKAKLYPPPNNVVDDPRPIDRADFHRLLATADQTAIPTVWRVMLLLGLNAALYMEDLCDLQWEAIDLSQRTLLMRRKKRGRCLRVAVLWDETVDALQAMGRRGDSPYVFVSGHGTRYNKNTKTNDFADLREKAGLPDVKFSHIRDGAYTTACNTPGVDEKFARLLAGHKSPGLQDRYVQRNPLSVKPACDAVYAVYGPFPRLAEKQCVSVSPTNQKRPCEGMTNETV